MTKDTAKETAQDTPAEAQNGAPVQELAEENGQTDTPGARLPLRMTRARPAQPGWQVHW
ncbi:hypothetical protein ACFQDZ_16220 [Sulfitobacter pacificus]|uniref:hypothetical protein n=1 Tax=Sulfitobacter pacificus TaxID=1499314 RepID=UPI003611416F